MRRTARRLATLAALLALAPLAGCEWWLTFQSGGSSLAEFLLQSGGYHIENGVIVPNTPPVPAPNAGNPPLGTAPGGGAGASGGAGGASGSSPGPAAAQPVQPKADSAKAAPAVPVVPVSMTIAGRMWRVIEARSAPVAPAPVSPAPAGAPAPVASVAPAAGAVSLDLRIEHSGLQGAARLLIPAAEWPTDSLGAPVSIDWKTASSAGAPLAGKATPVANEPTERLIPVMKPVSLPLAWDPARSAIEIAGQRYDVEVGDARLLTSDAAPSLPVAGAIDAVARRAGDANASKQLVRVRFEPRALVRAASVTR